MKKSTTCWAVIGLSLLLYFSACIPAATPTTTQDPNSLYTAAARTMEAKLTLAAGETAVAQLTQIALSDTPTPPQPTALPSPTELIQSPGLTLVPTLGSPPTQTRQPLPCDRALFVGDISVIDNTVFAPGAVFNKTWRVKNLGSCVWSPAYSLVAVSGDLMGEGSAIPLPGFVSPGETVDLMVTLTAPTLPGIYRGNWILRNPSGTLFGIGADASDALGVQIQVASPPRSGEFILDFAANYCSASWQSGAGPLSCPGSSRDPNGFVVLLDSPALESYQEDELAIWTRPDEVGNGWISGQYPAYRVRDRDRFVAEVGCLRDSRECQVSFQVDYQLSDGRIRNLGVWTESYDGLTTRIDSDLSSLAGSSVRFFLSVYNEGEPEEADAFWLVPHIESILPANDLVLVWHEESQSGSVCNELRVYRTGRQSGEAQAFSCKGDRQELGVVRLSDDEARQLVELIDRLETFDAEVFSASVQDPRITWMTFTGLGQADASNADILTLQNLAVQLFAAINR